MSIGFGIFLMAVGAILAFGVRDRSGSIDLSVVGVIIMLAGAGGIWLSYTITNRRLRVETPAIDPAVEEEYRDVQHHVSEPTHHHPADPPVQPQPHPTEAPAERVPDARLAAEGTSVPAPEDEVERHVELDPAANGLSIDVPDRTLPAHEDRPVRQSLRTRLAGRFRPRR